MKPEDFTLVESKKIEDIADLEAAAGDSPVIKLVNYCIYSAVKEGASKAEIAEALGVAVAMNTGAALVYSTRVLAAVDQAGGA